MGQPREIRLFSAVPFKLRLTGFIHHRSNLIANLHLICFNFIHEILTWFTEFQLYDPNENLNKNLLPGLFFYICMSLILFCKNHSYEEWKDLIIIPGLGKWTGRWGEGLHRKLAGQPSEISVVASSLLPNNSRKVRPPGPGAVTGDFVHLAEPKQNICCRFLVPNASGS